MVSNEGYLRFQLIFYLWFSFFMSMNIIMKILFSHCMFEMSIIGLFLPIPKWLLPWYIELKALCVDFSFLFFSHLGGFTQKIFSLKFYISFLFPFWKVSHKNFLFKILHFSFLFFSYLFLFFFSFTFLWLFFFSLLASLLSLSLSLGPGGGVGLLSQPQNRPPASLCTTPLGWGWWSA